MHLRMSNIFIWLGVHFIISNGCNGMGCKYGCAAFYWLNTISFVNISHCQYSQFHIAVSQDNTVTLLFLIPATAV